MILNVNITTPIIIMGLGILLCLCSLLEIGSHNLYMCTVYLRPTPSEPINLRYFLFQFSIPLSIPNPKARAF